MKKKTILIIIILLIISISLIFVYFTNKIDICTTSNKNNFDNTDDQDNSISDDKINKSITPILTIKTDRYNKTITIISIENGTNLLWDNVKIINGTANLPNGTIDEGDIITDCIGFLDFNWKPTNKIFLHCEFVRE